MEKDLIKFDWPKEAVIVMVQMWQKFECLYNPKNSFYHNKHARYDAFTRISEKLKEININVGPTEIKNKMSYMRGQYTREVSKMREKKSGAGAEDNYVPSAYWFNDLSFLEDFIKIRKGGCNLNTRTLDDSYDLATPLVDCNESPQPSKRARVAKDTSNLNSKEDEVLSAATAVLEKIVSDRASPSEERDANFCNFIKTELSEMKNQAIKDDLKENITLAIFNAKRKERTLSSNEYDFQSFGN